MQHRTQGFSTDVITINEYEHSMNVHLEPGTTSSASVQRDYAGVPMVILHVNGYALTSKEGQYLSVFIPWDLADAISTAYEHEAAGLAHEAAL
jgi:hypothetical protein